jgi:hypothetical protein
MQIAPTLAIIEVIPIVQPVRVTRDPEAVRERSQKWSAPTAIGRGQLIDLVV